MKNIRPIVITVCIVIVTVAGSAYALKAGWWLNKSSKNPSLPIIQSESTTKTMPKSVTKPTTKSGTTTANTITSNSTSNGTTDSVNKPTPQNDIAAAEKLYDTGFQIYMARRYDEAITYFNKAIEKDPTCYKAYNAKGIALCFKGNYDRGIGLIKKSLSIKPDFTYANFNMGLAYKLMKDYKSALKWFDVAIGYDPKDTWSYFGKACIYAEWNDTSNAIGNLRKAIETDPTVKITAKREPDLDNIKGTEEFMKLVND